MNKTACSMIIAMLTYCSSMLPQVDCLSNTHNLKQKYDSKEYHHEVCNCPCDTHAAYGKKTYNRNQCIECGHFHDARPSFVASGYAPDRPQVVPSIVSAQTWAQSLIDKAKTATPH